MGILPARTIDLLNLARRKLSNNLPERIGLKPLPCREKLKEDYSLLQSSSFQVEVAINYQLSTVNCQLSTEHLTSDKASSQTTDLDLSKLALALNRAAKVLP